MDYRKTLNLPQVDFPMKANLPKREPEIQRFWNEIDIYRRVLEATRDRQPFILHDGPPYANGDLHLGTALNKILKDIIIKYKTMSGHFCPYVPGWDCHGQPIEFNVEKMLGEEKSKLDIMEVRRRCRDYALHYRSPQLVDNSFAPLKFNPFISIIDSRQYKSISFYKFSFPLRKDYGDY